MSQEIYQKAVDLIEAKQYQEAYQLLLSISDYPQATLTISRLVSDGHVNPNRPDIPTAAFILPKKRQTLQQAQAEGSGFSKFLKRFFLFIMVLVVCGLAVYVALNILGN